MIFRSFPFVTSPIGGQHNRKKHLLGQLRSQVAAFRFFFQCEALDTISPMMHVKFKKWHVHCHNFDDFHVNLMSYDHC